MERDALTSEGRSIHVRPVRETDIAEIERFHKEELSDSSSYYRFFGMRPFLAPELLARWANADGARDATIVATQDGHIVAIALYQHLDDKKADIAFAVADRLQHRGVATLLFEDLVVLARRAGYSEFVASTLAGNRAMSSVFHSAGLHSKSSFDGGLADFVFPLDDVGGMEHAADERDRLAAAASLTAVLEPTHIVVIGASAGRVRPGNVVVRNLRATFSGGLSVVHPTAATIEGLDAYGSIADVPGPVDLVVVATAASTVAQVIDDCGAAGVRAAVILSAGFSETGAGGAALEAEVLARARDHGMRLVGPNCFGVANPALGMDTTFGSIAMRPGSIAFGSQSGGLGIALLSEVSRRGLGISSFVSLGNKADVSGNDLLCYLSRDPSTKVIALYLESFGNPRKFARLTRLISRDRPIVALKGGRSESGQRGARSHTAALTTNDKVVDALFAHGGVIRARTLEEMVDIVALIDEQSVPRGRRVAIVGNAGGPLILAADAADTSGLTVPVLPDRVQQAIHQIVPDAAATANPVDLLATVTPVQIASVVELLAASGVVDSIVVVTVQLGAASVSVPRPQSGAIPVVTVSMGSESGAMFSSPERAVQALSRAADHHEWLVGQSPDAISTDDVAADDAAGAAIAGARLHDQADGWLDMATTFATLVDLGVPVPMFDVLHDRIETAAAFEHCGPSAVMKADAVGVVHKMSAGAVMRGVSSVDDATAGFDRFADLFGDQLRGVLIQNEVESGPELIIGLTQTAAYGALLLVGAGGSHAELLRDQIVLVAPAKRADIVAAIRQLWMGPVFDQTGHVAQLADIAYRVGLLAEHVPGLAELDLNPVIASPAGVSVVDARIRLSADTVEVVPLRGLRPAHTR